MNTFISNINLYLSERRIKQNYVSLMTGWSPSKVSRILSGKTDICDRDKQCIADALGQNVNFFMQDSGEMQIKKKLTNQLAFFAGDLSEDDKKTALKLVDMFRFYDSIVNLQI